MSHRNPSLKSQTPPMTFYFDLGTLYISKQHHESLLSIILNIGREPHKIPPESSIRILSSKKWEKTKISEEVKFIFVMKDDEGGLTLIAIT